MILCEESYPQILNSIVAELTDENIELVFVDNNTMREINKSERSIDKTTDVLSFPLEKTALNSDFPIGSIVINLELVQVKASEFSHSNESEIALLFTHGLLHILGFDHEKDNGQMRIKECDIIAKFNLPKSLIVRTNEIDG